MTENFVSKFDVDVSGTTAEIFVKDAGARSLTAQEIADRSALIKADSSGNTLITTGEKIVESSHDKETTITDTNSTHVDGANTVNIGGPATEVYADTYGKTVSKGATYTYKGLVTSTFTDKCMLKFPNRDAFNLADVLTLSDKTAQNYIDVKEYGAVGDGITDDTVNIQKAIDACGNGTLFFSDGTYLITYTLTNKGCSIVGSGSATLIKNNAGSILTYDCDNYEYYYRIISGLHFTSNEKADGISIKSTKTSNNFFSNSIITNCFFERCHEGIIIDKIADTSGESHFDWNIITSNCFRDCNIGIHFAQGSGTGNLISNSTIICNQYCILYDGKKANIGDIIITGLHFGGNAIGIVITATSALYHERCSISNCQFDAGITKGISINTFSLFSIKNCIFGGATSYELSACTEYSLDYPQSNNTVTYAYNKVLTSGLNSICKVKMPNGIADITIISSTKTKCAYKHLIWNTFSTPAQTIISDLPSENSIIASQESASQIGVYYNANADEGTGKIEVIVNSMDATTTPQ